jgi:uncharacterized protein YcnI
MAEHRVLRLAAAVLVAAGILVGGAGVASAHVSVDAGGARQGADDAVLTFRVPNERSGARTIQVDITFPTRTPVGSVKPAAKPGWTVTTERVTYETPVVTPDGEITEGVGRVVFRASTPAGGIPEGTFDSFQVLVGPLPKGVSTLAFPTVQTYDGGQVSSWIQPSVAGTEPEHPAPVLTLAPAAVEPASAAPTPPTTTTTSASTPGDDRTARLLGLLGVVIGSAGLLAAGVAIGRSRRVPPDLHHGTGSESRVPRE